MGVMASLYITDADGTCLTYELPEDDSVLWVLGSAEEATITLAGEGIADRHATLSSLQSAPAITAADGPVIVNGETITEPTLLVEGVAYGVGGYTLTYGAPPAANEEGAEAQGRPRRRAVRRRGADVIPEPKNENILVALITPLYVITILIAAFFAGLTLRYWMMTGGYLPDVWLK